MCEARTKYLANLSTADEVLDAVRYLPRAVHELSLVGVVGRQRLAHVLQKVPIGHAGTSTALENLGARGHWSVLIVAKVWDLEISTAVGRVDQLTGFPF